MKRVIIGDESTVINFYLAFSQITPHCNISHSILDYLGSQIAFCYALR
jgi:hypothetical protein